MLFLFHFLGLQISQFVYNIWKLKIFLGVYSLTTSNKSAINFSTGSNADHLYQPVIQIQVLHLLFFLVGSRGKEPMSYQWLFECQTRTCTVETESQSFKDYPRSFASPPVRFCIREAIIHTLYVGLFRSHN